MIALMILATFWIPLVFLFKIWNKNSISYSDVIVYNDEHVDGKYMDNFHHKNFAEISKTYNRISMKLHIYGEKYDYVCLTKFLKWPIVIDYDVENAENWISKAVISYETHDEDVTYAVHKYSGPKGDFFGNYFKMKWMFSEVCDEANLKLYDDTDESICYVISLKTNEEINDKEDELKTLHNVHLYDEHIDDFVIAE